MRQAELDIMYIGNYYDVELIIDNNGKVDVRVDSVQSDTYFYFGFDEDPFSFGKVFMEGYNPLLDLLYNIL